MNVPNGFFGIRDLAYFKAGIRDFEGRGVRAPVAQLDEHRSVTREVVSSTPAGLSLSNN